MKVKRRNAFWMFCFSFMPGAAEMYMGLMKMGVSLMALFMFIAMVAAWTNIGPLLFLALVVWFYAFFHARNMAAMDDEELRNIKDEYLFVKEDLLGGKELFISYRKWIAALLILGGIAMLWKELYWMLEKLMEYIGFTSGLAWEVLDSIPQIVVAIVIIAAGIALIRGKKKELELEE